MHLKFIGLTIIKMFVPVLGLLACIVFQNDHIVPDVINACPSTISKITFPGKLAVNLGTHLTPNQTSQQPQIEWPTKCGGLYTLAMVDPDAPSRAEPTMRNWRHWLVMNIPGNRISKGDIVSAFEGPEPPVGTGYHRYVFLVYEQKQGHIKPPPRDDDDDHRGSFSIKVFATKYNLGEPVAHHVCKCTIMIAFQNDSIVPDILNACPQTTTKITFANNVSVNLGNELTPTQVKSQPRVEWPVVPRSLYTLTMLDLDVPSRANPAHRSVKHWMVINIPDANITAGYILDTFLESLPPRESGLHRYVTLIYRQSHRIEGLVRNDTIESRLMFNVTKFALDHQLGEPVAGNFYHAQWDEYVDVATFPNNITVNLGAHLTPAQTSQQPAVEWPTVQCALYTLALVDPDAPSRADPIYRNVRHWLVMNIPGKQISYGNIIAGFVGPAPPVGTGVHRYVFLVYEQKQGYIEPPPRDDVNRHNFSMEDFASNYTLGEPITFPSKASAKLGNELTLAQVKDEPRVVWPTTCGSLYTLAMMDANIPIALRSAKHWLVVNIPGNNITAGDILAGFIPSGPSQGSGIHRYVTVVYRQPQRIDGLVRNDTIESRVSFDVTKFARDHKLGKPLAGNFYHAQWEKTSA
ncbi:unnamed protein product [Medioppia subpectinata]|uniref:Phosphatidylethanolamine-binding protein n=1 Tax=Medioppia subpectinata TaxID=1979941 RepID=A0A7R9PZD4_9ACAR|nr:unnamed protein product [Medioppia subpectinata]CAG2106364.1 unnamed protein product [Medioppia subpectinata]